MEWAAAVELLDTIPGVGRATAELLIAEVGTDMGRFGSAARLASWAKVCPGNNESAGKRYSGRTGHGNAWLRSGLVQAAHSAVVVKDSYFAKVYRRLRVRRGGKRALMAVAHRLLMAVYHMLLKHEPYRAPEPTAQDERRKHQLVAPDATADRAPGLRGDDCCPCPRKRRSPGRRQPYFHSSFRDGRPDAISGPRSNMDGDILPESTSAPA